MVLSRSRLKVLQDSYERLEMYVKSKRNSEGKLAENLFWDGKFNGLDSNFCNLVNSYDSSDTDVSDCKVRYDSLMEFVESEASEVSGNQES
ncbi:hypothetical protein CMI38_05190 [Candidatus Pacearchaeota archaeon]|jgi:hypothetical protein|nr:hypothetical protein [Candidatus Pacearchaeota archaeon]|tara:strand:+ start:7845 stop:8117 length:273 start_codon:yes stop_codon:yes gene_type:complete